MPRINNTHCCGFKTITNLYGWDLDKFEEWFKNFENHPDFKDNSSLGFGDEDTGIVYQLLLSTENQLAERKRKIIEKYKFKLMSSWVNINSGNRIWCYQRCTGPWDV